MRCGWGGAGGAGGVGGAECGVKWGGRERETGLMAAVCVCVRGGGWGKAGVYAFFFRSGSTMRERERECRGRIGMKENKGQVWPFTSGSGCSLQLFPPAFPPWGGADLSESQTVTPCYPQRLFSIALSVCPPRRHPSPVARRPLREKPRGWKAREPDRPRRTNDPRSYPEKKSSRVPPPFRKPRR